MTTKTTRHNRAVPRPFLKWAGGKGQLLGDLVARMPERFGAYHEPFIGGGALFFRAAPARAVLTDTNARLVRTWRAVQQDVEGVLERLEAHRAVHSKDHFLALRQRDIDAEGDADVAAWMIYLSKTAFNGLYRVNSRNIFNVPWGRYKNPTIADHENLRACSAALKDATIERADFATVLDRAVPGDFVYFDPPYVPLSASSSFTAYTQDGFSMADQVRLRDLALALKAKGVAVLLSNSSAPAVRELYADGFVVEEVSATRNINSVGSGRGRVAELVMR